MSFVQTTETRGTIQVRSAGSASPARGAHSRDARAAAVRDAFRRIEGEYREMPGLSLTLPQVARLLGLERSTCEHVLTTLIERGLLKRAPNGAYIRR